jgi:8-oxo-dGTP pyrophosphatase MutT (NUDIX family)
MSDLVRAAGGVVVRWNEEGELEVLLVHRPAYDDWSLPKGKAHDGESDEDCALREVREETGVRCELGPELDSTSYIDGRGRPKLVRYWMMWPAAGTAQPYAEIDDVRWATPAEAAAMLSYDRDRAVLASLPGVSPRTS